MTLEIATKEPIELRAGLTWEWERQDLSDYPAPTWVVTYWFKRQGGTDKFSIVAAANGAYHRVSVPAATTEVYVADDYTWVAVAVSGTDARQVGSGQLKLLPKYNADEALDDRSHAKRVLEAIEAVIEGRATKDQEEYTIATANGSRSLKRTPLAELIILRARYKSEVLAERIAAGETGLGTGKLVYRL